MGSIRRAVPLLLRIELPGDDRAIIRFVAAVIAAVS